MKRKFKKHNKQKNSILKLLILQKYKFINFIF